MKKIFILILVILGAFCITSCSFIQNNTIKLNTPIIKKVENNKVYWESVANASSYILNVDDIYEKNVTDFSFDLSIFLNENKTGFVKVKAVGNGTIYSDSDWSNPYEYEFIKSDSSSSSNTQLNTPIIIDFIDNIVTWNEVENSIGYVVRINGVEKYIYKNYYEASFSEDCDFSIQIKALADSSNTNYVDSNWSSLQILEYVKLNNNDNNNYKDYLNYKLGFGINVITAEYFDSKAITSSTLLDIKQLSSLFELDPSKISQTTFKTIQEDTIEEFTSEFASKYASCNSASIGINENLIPFSVTLQNKIEFSTDFKISKSTRQYYNFTYQNIIDKRMSILNFDTTEIKNNNLLSSYAINELNKIVQETNEDVKEELILTFFDNFGSHIIKDALYGGKIEILYYLLTNDTSFDFNNTVEYNTSLTAAGSYEGLKGQLSSSDSISNKLQIGKKDSNTTSIYEARFIGGGGVAVSSNNISQFYSNCDEWVKNYNSTDDKNTMIGLNDNGLVPIWELLPDEYADLAKLMKEIFTKKLESVNNEFLDKFKYEVDLTKEFSGGRGTSNDPYLIENEYQLELINNYLNQDVYFKLIKDIKIENNWMPIGSHSWEKGENPQNCFTGNFDGNNKTITYSITIEQGSSELKVKLKNYSYGLFGAVKNAKIYDLTVNATIKTIDYNQSQIWDIDNNHSPHNNFAGSISGWASNTEVKNCNVNSKIHLLYEGNWSEGWTRVGGIFGYLENGKVYNVNISGDLKAMGFKPRCGGVVGTKYNCVIENDNTKLVNVIAQEGAGWLFGNAKYGSQYGDEGKA